MSRLARLYLYFSLSLLPYFLSVSGFSLCQCVSAAGRGLFISTQRKSATSVQHLGQLRHERAESGKGVTVCVSLWILLPLLKIPRPHFIAQRYAMCEEMHTWIDAVQSGVFGFISARNSVWLYVLSAALFSVRWRPSPTVTAPTDPSNHPYLQMSLQPLTARPSRVLCLCDCWGRNWASCSEKSRKNLHPIVKMKMPPVSSLTCKWFTSYRTKTTL